MRFVICGDDNDGDLKGCRRTGRCDRHHRLRGPARQGLRQARNHAKRVRDAARKLGYKINLSGRSLRSGRSDTITFLTSGIEGDYFSHLAMCVAEEVHKRGSHMLIELSRYLTDDNDLSYTFSDGIIAINAPRAVDILKRHPAVMLENYDTSLPIDTVNAPSDAGSRAAVQHLITRGCARIGIVGDNRDPNNPNIIPGSRDIRMRAAKESRTAV